MIFCPLKQSEYFLGQMNSLLKQMKHEKTPTLRKYITLPLLLSPDRDEELLKLTEHRSALCHFNGKEKPVLFSPFFLLSMDAKKVPFLKLRGIYFLYNCFREESN